eukprot:GHVO01045940.1.p1 GENE.GHVO01045940.1~~GHVO01045940.1.p1  ORF type:complete len:216 (+),score=23.80 GHVO01045940.1:40-687(+)
MKSIIAVLLMTTVCYAYKAGPPVLNKGFCTSMMPSHNDKAAQDMDTFDSKYIFETDYPCYKNNSLITVTLQNVENATEDMFFEGFFVQARMMGVNDKSYGTFDKADNYPKEFEDNVEALDCFEGTSNSIGHAGSKHQVMAPLAWTAPSGLTTKIEFVATVVFHKETFWVGAKASLEYDANCAAPTAPPPPASSADRVSGVTALLVTAVLAIKSLF